MAMLTKEKFDGMYEEENKMGISEVLTVEEETKRDRFFRLINQLEIYQEGPLSMEHSDLLKVTYNKEDYYHVVFGVDGDKDQVYDAVYQGGEAIFLHPKNNELLVHLQSEHSHPDNILTNVEKSYLLSVSNTFTKNIEEYQAIKLEIKKDRNSLREFENTFNEVMDKHDEIEDVIGRYKGFNDLHNKISGAFLKYERMDELLQSIHPKFEKLMDEKNYRSEIDSKMQTLFNKFDNPQLFQNGAFKQMRELQELTKKVASLELQFIRKEGYEGGLYTNPEQAMILSRFDTNKPFQDNSNLHDAPYGGASRYFETLIQEQISEPKQIVQHYLTIQDKIENYVDNNFTHIDRNLLANYSFDAVQKAVQTIELSFSDEHASYQELDLSLSNEFVYWNYDGYSMIKGNGELAERLKAVGALQPEQPINVLNIASASNLTKNQREFWQQRAEQMIQFHVGRPIPSNDDKRDFSFVKKGLESLIDAEKRNRPNTQPKLENQMMDYIKSNEPTQAPEKQKELVEIER